MSTPGKQAVSAVSKAMGVVLAASVTGYFSYRSAQVESEAGYTVMAAAVKELQAEVKTLHHENSKLQGQVEVLLMRRSAVPPPPDHPFAPAALPVDLEGAYKMVQLKK